MRVDCLTVTTGLATAAYADSGRIRFNVIRPALFGGSGGRGTLAFHGRYYPLAIGGVSWMYFRRLGNRFRWHVTDIRRPSDVNGVYGAAGAALRSAQAEV